jgi:hypothetical protein
LSLDGIAAKLALVTLLFSALGCEPLACHSAFIEARDAPTAPGAAAEPLANPLPSIRLRAQQ